MSSQALKDLAAQISKLTFSDMMEFSKGVEIASYHNGLTRAEQLLKWAASITKPEPAVPTIIGIDYGLEVPVKLPPEAPKSI